MKFYRTMSIAEFHKYCAGCMVSNGKQSFKGKPSTSFGMCFMPETVEVATAEFAGKNSMNDTIFPENGKGFDKPYTNIRKEYGIDYVAGFATETKDAFIVEFEGEDNIFTKTYGMYTYGVGKGLPCIVSERSIISYDRETLVCTRYGYVSPEGIEWYNF